MPARSAGFVEYVLEQLADLDGVESRAMFGGHGLYCRGVFFGIVHKGRLYFRTDDASRPEYVQRKMKPFRPKPGMTLKTYYEVPVDVQEDREALAAWARRASEAGERAVARTGQARAAASW